MHFTCNLSPITTNGNVESNLIDFVAHTKVLTIIFVSFMLQFAAQMMECRRGCIERAADPNLRRNPCRNRCVSPSCNSEYGGTPL